MKKPEIPVEKELLPEDITPPPFFNTWPTLYWLVLGNLAFCILLFYLLTIAYK